MYESCPCRYCTARRERLAFAAMVAELDTPHEPPTANNPAELPDQEGRRYPLMKITRESAPTLVLLAYLFRLMWWRCTSWSRRRRGIEDA